MPVLVARVVHHPVMSEQEWDEPVIEAQRSFYPFEHMDKIFKRMVQLKSGMRMTTLYDLLIYREGPRLDRVAPGKCGLGRIIRRRQRRSGLPLEHPLVFYPRTAWHFARMVVGYSYTFARLRISLTRAWRAWEKQDLCPYTDESIAMTTATIDPLVSETLARSTPYAINRQEKRIRAKKVRPIPSELY